MFKNDTTKKIATNTIFQVIGKIISMTITVLITVLIARNYGRNAYGEFSIMQNWPALFYIIIDFGLNAVAVRELSKDWTKADSFFNTILTLRVIFSVILVLLISITALLFPYSSFVKTGLILTLWLILTQGLYASGNIIFQTKLKYDYSTVSYLIGYVAIVFLVLIAIIFKLNIIFISFSYVLGGLITYLISVFYIKKLGVTPRIFIDKKIMKYLMIQAIPLGLMFVFSQINFKSDAILMSFLPLSKKFGYSNTDAVALYALPYKIFEVSLVAPTFFMNAVYPVLVRHLTESKDKFLDTFKKAILVLVIIAVVGSIVGFLLSPIIIKLLGGKEFLPSIVVLRILMSGLIFYFLTQPLAWFIVTLEKQKYLPRVYLISAIFNVTANLIFIPKYIFYASSVITHLSELLILILLILTARKAWIEKYA